MIKKAQSDFLFSQPSFASGVSRTIDLWGQFDDYNSCESPTEADSAAINSDWSMVGQDIFQAIEHFESDFKVA